MESHSDALGFPVPMLLNTYTLQNSTRGTFFAIHLKGPPYLCEDPYMFDGNTKICHIYNKQYMLRTLLKTMARYGSSSLSFLTIGIIYIYILTLILIRSDRPSSSIIFSKYNIKILKNICSLFCLIINIFKWL